MSDVNRTRHRPLRAALASLALVWATACSSGSSMSWTEDVKLPDGRVIALERYVEFKGPSSGFGEPATESRQTLKFKHPTTGEVVRWDVAREQGFLETVALWLDKETPVLLAQPAYGGDFRRRNCPNPPYLAYEHVQGEWRQRPLAQLGVDRLRSNMTTYTLEKRQHIENGKRRLGVSETSESFTFRNGNVRVPYVLDFKNMPTQTFDEQSCNYPSRLNYLLFTEGK